MIRKRLAWGLAELAGELSVSLPFLRKEVRVGSLKAKKIGRRVVVLAEDVERYLASRPEWKPTHTTK